jgi:hypothetical protein
MSFQHFIKVLPIGGRLAYQTLAEFAARLTTFSSKFYITTI